MSFVDILYKDTVSTIHIHTHEDCISNHIKINKSFFEIGFLDYIFERYPNHKEIIDIGSNIGNHAVFFKKYLNCTKVHCFEPHPLNIDLLKKNTHVFDNKCLVYECALSNIEGKLPLFNSCEANLGGFSLHSYANGSSFKVLDEVEIHKLDMYDLDNITMIKIDVENHENEVLEGAKETIRKNRPIIFLENLNHGYPNVVPEKEPHWAIMTSYNYKKIDSNICNSYMDLWVPNEF